MGRVKTRPLKIKMPKNCPFVLWRLVSALCSTTRGYHRVLQELAFTFFSLSTMRRLGSTMWNYCRGPLFLHLVDFWPLFSCPLFFITDTTFTYLIVPHAINMLPKTQILLNFLPHATNILIPSLSTKIVEIHKKKWVASHRAP